MADTGLIHVYYGNGKGKTTAALGLALRACGYGKRIVLVQFLKSSPSGELISLARLGITVHRGHSGGFSFNMTDADKLETKRHHDENLAAVLDIVSEGKCDLLILDEALDAYQLGLLDGDMLNSLINHKPAALELCITGHNPVGWIIDKADYVTQMTACKHPFNSGITARKGIEY